VSGRQPGHGGDYPSSARREEFYFTGVAGPLLCAAATSGGSYRGLSGERKTIKQNGESAMSDRPESTTNELIFIHLTMSYIAFLLAAYPAIPEKDKKLLTSVSEIAKNHAQKRMHAYTPHTPRVIIEKLYDRLNNLLENPRNSTH